MRRPPRPDGPVVRARGGKDGYEPPTVRMRRDERVLELAMDRWSQRRIAAEVGLSQVGVLKALRRILRHHAADVQQDLEAQRVRLLLLAERRARAARDGHARSTEDITTRRQRKVAGTDGAAATTTVELETHSSAGNPHYLAVEQRCDEFAAQLLGLHDIPVVQPARLSPAGATPAHGVRQLNEITTDTLERVHADLTRSPDPDPA